MTTNSLVSSPSSVPLRSAAAPQRDARLDLVKAIAIYLVVLGHVIQNALSVNGGNDFFSHPLFEFIYTFHMPLFFVISGYFAQRALTRPLTRLVTDKLLQLVLPAIAFRIVYAKLLGIGTFTFPYINCIGFWFIGCLFLCFMTAGIGLALLRSFYAGLLIPALLLSTGAWETSFLYLGQMYIFFVAGLILRRHQTFLQQRARLILAIVLPIFLLSYALWQPDYVVYLSAHKAWLNSSGFHADNLYIYLLRVLIGLAGSLILIAGSMLISPLASIPPLLQSIGANTLGIFFLQGYFIGVVSQIVHQLSGWIYPVSPAVVWVGAALIITLISYLICRILRLSQLTSFIFLGSRWHPAGKVPDARSHSTPS